MPWHPLSTGLFLVPFSLAAVRQEMLLQAVDENQTLQERNKSLGNKFPPPPPTPFAPHPLFPPGSG